MNAIFQKYFLNFYKYSICIGICASFLISGCSSSDKNSDQVPDVTTDGGAPNAESVAAFDPQLSSRECESLPPASYSGGEFSSPAIQCGMVTVPADWRKPSGEKIQIAVVKIPSSSETPSTTPIVYLEGGPGGRATAVTDLLLNEHWKFLLEFSDVYLVDQRGTGASIPQLGCFEIFTQVDQDAAHAACANRHIASGVDLSNFNTAYNALDFEAVRLAYNIEQWNLFGGSYGTLLGLVMMRDAPLGIRSVILDSVYPPQVNGISEINYSQYWAINQIVELCSTDSACVARYPNLLGTIEDGVERLSTSPVEFLSASQYVENLADQIANPELLTLIDAVATATDNELEFITEDFIDEADSLLDPSSIENIDDINWELDDWTAMGYSVTCAEEYPYLDSQYSPDISGDFRTATQHAVAAVAPPFNGDYCSHFDVQAAKPSVTEPVSSSIPTLVLSGSADSATPVPWSQGAAETLSNAQFFEFEALGHVIMGTTACVVDITMQFLSAPDEAVDAQCTDDHPVFTYFMP